MILREIDILMLHEIGLEAWQWEKLREFFGHNMGNSLTVISLEAGYGEDNINDIRRAVDDARERFNEMMKLMDRRVAGEKEDGEDNGKTTGTESASRCGG